MMDSSHFYWFSPTFSLQILLFFSGSRQPNLCLPVFHVEIKNSPCFTFSYWLCRPGHGTWPLYWFLDKLPIMRSFLWFFLVEYTLLKFLGGYGELLYSSMHRISIKISSCEVFIFQSASSLLVGILTFSEYSVFRAPDSPSLFFLFSLLRLFFIADQEIFFDWLRIPLASYPQYSVAHQGISSEHIGAYPQRYGELIFPYLVTQ